MESSGLKSRATFVTGLLRMVKDVGELMRSFLDVMGLGADGTFSWTTLTKSSAPG